MDKQMDPFWDGAVSEDEAQWLGRFHCAGCAGSRGPDVCLECWEDEERIQDAAEKEQKQ